MPDTSSQFLLDISSAFGPTNSTLIRVGTAFRGTPEAAAIAGAGRAATFANGLTRKPAPGATPRPRVTFAFTVSCAFSNSLVIAARNALAPSRSIVRIVRDTPIGAEVLLYEKASHFQKRSSGEMLKLEQICTPAGLSEDVMSESCYHH